MPILLLALGAAAIWYLSSITDLAPNSQKEDTNYLSDSTLVSLPVTDSIGWPYYYSKGSPSTPWDSGSDGIDCGGYALMVSVRIGNISPSCPDMNTATIANNCDKIEIGSQMPGDFAYYPGHIMVVCSEPLDANGHSAVIGASGGTRTTLGNNPNAKVKVFSTPNYRDDFVCYMRWKPDFKYKV